jgi:hypothetical protein
MLTFCALSCVDTLQCMSILYVFIFIWLYIIYKYLATSRLLLCKIRGDTVPGQMVHCTLLVIIKAWGSDNGQSFCELVKSLSHLEGITSKVEVDIYLAFSFHTQILSSYQSLRFLSSSGWQRLQTTGLYMQWSVEFSGVLLCILWWLFLFYPL